MDKEKLNLIYDGWKNLIFPNVRIESMAKQRAMVCSGCKYNKANICKICGCFIPAKVRATKSKCPLKKWEKELNL